MSDVQLQLGDRRLHAWKLTQKESFKLAVAIKTLLAKQVRKAGSQFQSIELPSKDKN